MRWGILLLAPMLGGCVTDNGAGFTSSISAFSAAFTTQDNLEVDLMKDLARKSNELEFVSNHTYSCGDPNDRYLIEAGYNYQQLDLRFAKKPKGYDALLAANKKEREKDALLKAIATYGSTIKGIASGYQALHDNLTTIQKDVDTLKSSAYLAEVAGMLGALSTVLKIADGVSSATEGAAIYDAARTMQPALQAAAKKLKDEHALANLTDSEAKAFSYWDSCATERLRFIRDYYPSYYKPKRADLYSYNDQGEPHLRFQGMAPTSVLDFAKEYRQYLLDREVFIARRPNYVGLIDAIVKANADIVTATPQDALAGASQLVGLTSLIPASAAPATTATKPTVVASNKSKK
ncbi:hypothetical protein NLM33_46620 [Bradyrhizobium sp. CCGUVB1N3]|uniref:hypothetical protein n=1 Tax=Bradyrhizobium sp. CCGUVB1N3 TaxID=2949629 RepID=UPI0020B2F1DC|nr:hypothetical protein [Bradyrhizobium sp. CCGUVB1N3]MCP3477633.1 hypothetical protein [Bradyrhizobium sp. CCGUVB1N3]